MLKWVSVAGKITLEFHLSGFSICSSGKRVFREFPIQNTINELVHFLRLLSLQIMKSLSLIIYTLSHW